MVKEIDREQYELLVDTRIWDTKEEFNKLLEEVTGITAESYVGYLYYDANGNYIGDSNDSAVKDLLINAHIRFDTF